MLDLYQYNVLRLPEHFLSTVSLKEICPCTGFDSLETARVRRKEEVVVMEEEEEEEREHIFQGGLERDGTACIVIIIMVAHTHCFFLISVAVSILYPAKSTTPIAEIS